MKNRTQQTILLTGASGGMGVATALLLSQKHKVIAVDIDYKKLLQLKKKAASVSIYKADLSKLNQIESLSKKVKQDFKNIDWLINMAGWVEKRKGLEKYTNSEIEKIVAINTLAPMYLSKINLKTINKGIINISSTAALSPRAFYTIYAASKTALNNFSQGIAEQMTVLKTKKSIITICPGATNTKMRQKVAQDADKHQNPLVVAETISEIVDGKSKYKNGDLVKVAHQKQKLISSIK